MEEAWVVERAKLRDLITAHPQWSNSHLVTVSGHSVFWVKKWRKRFKANAVADETVLHGLSRRRKQPPARVDKHLENAIL